MTGQSCVLGSSLVARPRVTEPIELWSSDIYLLRILFFVFLLIRWSPQKKVA